MAIWDRIGFAPPILPSPSLDAAIYNAGDWYAKHQQAQIDQARHNQQLAQAQQNQWVHTAPAMMNEPTIHQKATHLLKLRLAGLGNQFHMSPDEFLACHVANDTVYTFFVIGDKAGHIEEETALFPSDKLITQFRLIR